MALAILFPASSFAESPVWILYHEPLVLLEDDPDIDGPSEGLRFDAFGRRFEIELTAPIRSGPTADIEVITGVLTATPGSWVRLTRRIDESRGSELRGIIHDQTDTYVVEPRSANPAKLIGQDAHSDSINIIYRLADTLVAPGLLSCPTHGTNTQGDPVNAKVAFAELAAELGTTAALQADDVDDVARIGVITDASFRASQNEDSQFAVASLYAVVDGFYTEQLNVRIDPVDIFDAPDGINSPISTTQNGEDLLAELSAWRIMNHTQYALTHLITNRQLKNDDGGPIAGISFLGSAGRSGVCDDRTGIVISEWIGSLTSLVIAHEIGHTFGAPHDGEPSGVPGKPNACVDTPSSQYLMSTRLKYVSNDQFSDCSIEQMRPVIAAASCLRPLAATAFAAAGDRRRGSGGGALNWISILALLVIGALRRRSRNRASRSIH
jgi:hypothetical protein